MKTIFDDIYLKKSFSFRTPHHSGIYPVHQILYKILKEDFSIQAMSTQTYPAIFPVYFRRGFIFNGIMVRFLIYC
jgi:hypothetical protein